MNGLPRMIKWLRHKHGYSQQQLAALVGVTHQSQVSKWERGEVAPTDDNLDKLAAALGCRIERRWVGDNLQTRFVPLGTCDE